MNTINIMGSSLIGVYATCTNDICLVPCGCSKELVESIKHQLDVRVYSCLISDSILIGSLCKGNENGFLVPNGSMTKKIELEIEKKMINIPGNINAIGNIMLLNDTACLIHPEVSERSLKLIKNTLNVDIERGTIGNMKTVGMAGYVTNRGLLVNSKINEEEFEKLERLFGMKPTICSVNLGSYMIGSSVLANDKHYLVGNETTGYEMGQIVKGLGFVENIT